MCSTPLPPDKSSRRNRNKSTPLPTPETNRARGEQRNFHILVSGGSCAAAKKKKKIIVPHVYLEVRT